MYTVHNVPYNLYREKTNHFQELALENEEVRLTYLPCLDSMYAIHLLRWREVFPKEQMLVVDGDRLLIDPLPELRRLETFLGIPHRITEKMIYFDEEKGFLCMVQNGKKRCLGKTKGQKHPTVNSEVIHKLRQYFVPLNKLFYKLVDLEFNW